MKPKILEEDLRLFVNTRTVIETSGDQEYIMVFIPLMKVSPNEGLPALMEGSHREKNKGAENKPYCPIIWPGQALMFHAQLRCRIPKSGGGVLVARVYDVTGM